MGKGIMGMRFILSRTNDREVHSKRWIVGYGLLFWLISRVVSMILIIGCVAVYNIYDINPENLTKFTGNPETAKDIGSTTYTLLTVGLIAPLLEECIFRLGLSFKRWQIALAVASIPAYLLWQHFNHLTATSAVIYCAGIILSFTVIYGLTTNSFWLRQKECYFKSAVWLSAIAFGIIHVIAFSYYSIMLLPYILCVISVPFFAGCAITYYRINLGFWWAVGLHVFNNLPGIIMMISQ
ncbi:MAG: CPBP family intramembrane metalloprotease [Muribaculaceae bacterium]|nr:CPBP family intramembrane metalloprotease [Muribaculaceae bacterium]